MAFFTTASDALTAALAIVDADLRKIDINEGLSLYLELVNRRATIQDAIGAVSSGGGSGSQTIVLAVFRATAAGTGYSTNDIIILRQTPPASAEYFNASTSAVIPTPSSTNLGTVSTASNVAVTASALPAGAATSALQSATQSAAGSDASNAIAIQGVTNGKAIPVLFSGALPTGTNIIGSIANTAFTANASTNLNTSALALESTGNLAGINNKLPSSLGEKNKVGSLSVTPATDAIFAIASEIGFLSFRNTTLSNSASQIKATAGQTRGWNLINPNTVAVYVKLYDALAANVVVGTTAVVRTLAIPAGSVFFLEAQPVSQDDFLTAISIACVTGLLDNSATAPTTPIHAGVRYK